MIIGLLPESVEEDVQFAYTRLLVRSYRELINDDPVNAVYWIDNMCVKPKQWGEILRDEA